MTFRRITLVSLIMVIVGVAGAFGSTGAADAAVPAHPSAVSDTALLTPTLNATSLPPSAAWGTSVQDQVTVLGQRSYVCPQVDADGDKLYHTSVPGAIELVCSYAGRQLNCIWDPASGEVIQTTAACPADPSSAYSGPLVTGTVTFSLYGNSSGLGSAVFTDTETLDDTAAATSQSYTPTAAGTYYWFVSYPGDDDYYAADQSVGAVIVAPALTSVSTQASTASSTILVARSPMWRR